MVFSDNSVLLHPIQLIINEVANERTLVVSDENMCGVERGNSGGYSGE